MKKILADYWAVITFVIAFILDEKYQILEHFISDEFYLNVAKGIGALILGYITNKNLKSTMQKKEEHTQEQLDAIIEANEILNGVGLELIGTRPNDR
jgi:hypothetical protein